MPDRFGIGWRPELAADILANRDRIDLVEAVVDDAHVDGARLRSLRALARQMPTTVHGVSLGLASTLPAERRRLERMARIVDAVRPEYWSEHLAFVRAGGIELGHLAQPPRTEATIAGAVRNLAAATRAAAARPLVENVATLVDPPGSRIDEAAWVSTIADASGCDLLLDLQNVHTNATNLGLDALAYVQRVPAHRIRAIHLAGGRSISDGEDPGAPARILDDHLHDVPDDVYALLEAVAARAPRPLDVIIERDGAYPPFPDLLAQLDRARAAVARGRRRAARSAA